MKEFRGIKRTCNLVSDININSMDYLMITPSYPPIMGGVERHVVELHAALGQLGLRGKIVVVREPPEGTIGSKNVIWSPYRRLWGWIPKTTRLLAMWKLAILFQKAKPKIIHFHDSTIYPVFPLLRLYGLLSSTWMTFHGWEGICPPASNVVQKRQRIAKAVRGSIAIGNFIEKWYGTHSDIVNYGGVDVDRYSSLKTTDLHLEDLHMGYFGRLEADTGILELVEAVQLYTTKSGKKVILDIYGEGSLKDKLLSGLQNNLLSNITIFTPVRDISSVLAKCNIVVASGYLTIIEALCAGRIVFAQYQNPLREDYLRMHPAAASMFICKNTSEFSEAISQCSSDPDGVIRRSQPGWAWARKQSWKSVALSYLGLWGLTEKA